MMEHFSCSSERLMVTCKMHYQVFSLLLVFVFENKYVIIREEVSEKLL